LGFWVGYELIVLEVGNSFKGDDEHGVTHQVLSEIEHLVLQLLRLTANGAGRTAEDIVPESSWR
jgi:hypothetical protein